MTPTTYQPGQRSTRSGRLATHQPPQPRPHTLTLVRWLAGIPAGRYHLTDLLAAHNSETTPPRAATPAALLAAIEYAGGGLARAYSRRHLDDAAVDLAGPDDAAAVDIAVHAALHRAGQPATAREVQRHVGTVAASAWTVRGALDRLLDAGLVRWLCTDPVPWGTWTPVPDDELVAGLVVARGPAPQQPLGQDPGRGVHRGTPGATGAATGLSARNGGG